MTGYAEYAPAAEYLHLLSAPMWPVPAERLGAVLDTAGAEPGVAVEFGAGSGLGTEVLLNRIGSVSVLAAEPSAHLRAVLPARLQAVPGDDRMTVFPCGAAELALPQRIVAVTGIHMIGHLAPPVAAPGRLFS